MDKKKQIERHELEKFVSNESLKFLVYSITDFETPDFIVNINKKIISIEHTKLINPTLKQVEAYKNQIIKKAHKRFEEKYSANLNAHFTFKNVQLKGGKTEEEKYVNEIFTLIEEVYLKNKELQFNISSKRNKNASENIEYFSVTNTRNLNHWEHFGAYLVDWIDMQWLQSVISKKEDDIHKYPTKYDENWLLMVSDFGTKASANRVDFIDFSVIKSQFDKIYIYSYRADEVTVVK